MEKRTGELASYSTRVKVSNLHKHSLLVKLGASESQAGRKFVRTVSADVLRRTEGGA